MKRNKKYRTNRLNAQPIINTVHSTYEHWFCFGLTCATKPSCWTYRERRLFYFFLFLQSIRIGSLTHPPFSLIHATNSSSITSAMPSINLGKYSGWFCRIQSTDRPAARANNAIICKKNYFFSFEICAANGNAFTFYGSLTLDHVMSARKRSRETVANVTTTDSTDCNSPPLDRHNCRATPENNFGCMRSSSSPTCKRYSIYWGVRSSKR